MSAFTAFLETLVPERTGRVLLCCGARTEDLLVYAGLALACAHRVAEFRCELMAEDCSGKLDADAVWAVVEQLKEPVF